MLRGIFNAASGLGVLQARMDVTSNNLANVSTNGFKQDKVQMAAFPEFMLQEKMKLNIGGHELSEWSQVGRTNQGVAVTGVVTDFRTGIIQATEKETDLALSGDGFFAFEVKDGNGTKILYSRDGELSRDSEGYLVDTRGNRILGQDGPVNVGNGSFTVDSNGLLTTSGGEQIQLRILGVLEGGNLVKEGDNYFSFSGEGVAPAKPGVSQGFLEKSNVDVSAEMVNMVEIMRAYEAGQKLIQTQDDLLNTSIKQVGKVR